MDRARVHACLCARGVPAPAPQRTCARARTHLYARLKLAPFNYMLIIYTARSYIGSLPCRKLAESNPLSRKIELEVISKPASAGRACADRSVITYSHGECFFIERQWN